MTIKMGCFFCLRTRSVFVSVKANDCWPNSDSSKVSTRQMPSNGLYWPARSMYSCSMFMLAM